MPFYHIRTCLPVLHSLTGNRADSHLHSMELSMYLPVPKDAMLQFSEVEAFLDQCLAPYKHQFLNELPEFRDAATIEQMGEVFFSRLQEALTARGLTLERLEIGESPLRTYIIRREDGNS